jgi:hypothetical protein
MQSKIYSGPAEFEALADDLIEPMHTNELPATAETQPGWTSVEFRADHFSP